MSTDDWQTRLAALKATMPDEGVETDATADEQPARQAKKETLEVIFERKGRGGKVATIIAGFSGPDEAVAEVASRLKKALGTGGSARGGEILIQGDRREAVGAWLCKEGYKVKGA